MDSGFVRPKEFATLKSQQQETILLLVAHKYFYHGILRIVLCLSTHSIGLPHVLCSTSDGGQFWHCG